MKKRLLIFATVAAIAVGLLSSRAIRGLIFQEPMLKGINLPSGTFAAQKLPGDFSRDYFYPDRKDIEFYKSLGMNVFRIGFLWERLQPELSKPLSGDELRHLDTAVRAALAAGATVILDAHNFGRYHGYVIGSPEVPTASLADLWKRLASFYRDTDGVIFGLMNEPHDIEPITWAETAQAAIRSIRETGATQRIFVSPTQWASAAHFTAAGVVWKGITDPADNFAFEVHQYVDADGSGTHGDCPDVQAGRAAIQLTTNWLQENKRKAFLGEFGASTRPDCLNAASQMLTLLQANPSVWLGWTYFAGGRGWGEADLLPIPPILDPNKPQLTMLKKFLTP